MKWNDQIGNTINGLKILDVKRENKRTLVKTICPHCGAEFWLRTERVKTQKSCGCLTKTTQFRSKDLRGQKFGRLSVVKETEKRDKDNRAVIWLCRCECGNMCEVASTDLRQGMVRSCGCLKKEWQHKHGKEIGEATKEKCIEGTNVRNLTSKLPKNNTSGIKGVTWDKAKNKWHAQIGFKGKNYHLGRYANKEDAIYARKEAEDHLFGEFLKWYYKERKDK